MPFTAPYRFIPIKPNRVIEPPVALDGIRFDTPLDAGSVSATLEVTWTAKTPVCVGARDAEAGPIQPLKVGDRYCLPGASLRGMLRSVVEIATFSHLGRINGHRHASHRDFVGIEGSEHHAVRPDMVKAGWLRWEEDPGVWKLYPAKYHGAFLLVPVNNIADGLTDAGEAVTPDEWLLLETEEKYRKLSGKWVVDEINTLMADATINGDGQGRPTRAPLHPKARVFRKKGDPFKPFSVGDGSKKTADVPTKGVVLVCTGPAPEPPPDSRDKRKANEALFPLPVDENEAQVIPTAWMNVFHRMHADPGREGGNPRGAWRAWLRGMGWTHVFKGFEATAEEKRGDCPSPPGMTRGHRPQGIPVFWKGTLPIADPDKGPGRQHFWLSLSRVFRVPHEYSVGEVAQRLYGDGGTYDPPRLEQPNGWDFARALFGEVDGANRDAREADREEQADGTKTERALRGRVAVGFAWAPEGTQPDPDPKRGVFAQPRESFWPFYLREKDDPKAGGSYSSPDVVPAGRKRTVVRSDPVPQAAWPQGNENERTLTTLRFLPAGTAFTGQIRVHNLHPVEFGALLWALTFGDTSGGHWHQIGRAKGLGHGALSPSVSFTKGPLVHPADPEAEARPIEDWIPPFTAFMDTRLGPECEDLFLKDPAIRALVASADPAKGQSMAASLTTGSLDAYTAWRNRFKGAVAGTETIDYPLDDLS